VAGKDGWLVRRERPWYKDKKTPTFSDMLGALRMQLWEGRISRTSGEGETAPDVVRMLVNRLAAVG
jgi:hypothetical protein